MGLLKRRSKLPFKEYLEEIRRSGEAGKEIHRNNTEEMLRAQDTAEADREARRNPLPEFAL